MNRQLIIALSVIIPLFVALLFKVKINGVDLSFLPPIYASINAITFLTLCSAWLAIKNKQRILHERLIKLCLFFSSVFLILYVAYHSTSDPTHYGGIGVMMYLYYFLLISHIVLSVAIIPLVLFTLQYALLGSFEKHKKLARISFPLWLYVTFSGVLVYLMISPYYE